MKKLLLILLLPLMANAQSGEKLEQIPIVLYDQMRAFEENRHLKFLAQIPDEVYKDGDIYRMKIDDYNVTYDGFYFKATKEDEYGNIIKYKLVVKDKVPLGVKETIYKNGYYYNIEVFYKNSSRYYQTLK